MTKNKERKIQQEELIHDWTIFCVSSSVDEKTNNISLFNIVENMGVEIVLDEEQSKNQKEKGWYSVPLNLELISRFHKEKTGRGLIFDLQYEILDPDQNMIGKKFGSTLKFGKDHDNLRMRNKLGVFPLTKSGLYKILVSIKDVGSTEFRMIGEMSFKVDLVIKKENKKK